jgi:tetratricopeptide (TPR) repeat protein
LLYRPAALSSYRLVQSIGGPGPLPQHIVNILLHAVNCVLVVRLFRRLGLSSSVVVTGGLLFAALPIHSEVIASVVGRSDLLAALGVLIVLLAHQSATSAEARSIRLTWTMISALAALLAMCAKESGVTVVLLVPLFHAFLRKKQGLEGSPGRQRSPVAFSQLAYLAIPIGAYFLLRFVALDGQLHQRPAVSKTINILVDAPAWQRALGVLQLWGMYWWKTVRPDVLSCTYSVNAIRLATGLNDLHVLLGLSITVVMVATSIFSIRKGSKIVALTWLLLLVSYLPTSNALVLIRVFFAERIWYLPSIFAVLLISSALVRMLPRMALVGVISLMTLGMGVRCWVRCDDWRGNETLYAAAYRDQPNSVTACYLRGQWLATHGQPARGIGLLREAIDIDLGYTDAHRSLGQAYLSAGSIEGALHHLQIADMQVPGHPPTTAQLELVRSLMQQARSSQLQSVLRAALEAPQDVQAELSVVRMLRELGRPYDAIARFKAGTDRFADSAAWQAEYAVTLIFLNRIDEAIERYRLALALNPDDIATSVELAMLLLERRAADDVAEAWQLANAALAAAPTNPNVLVCQAELHAFDGNIGEALQNYRAAIGSLAADDPRRSVFAARARVLGGE